MESDKVTTSKVVEKYSFTEILKNPALILTVISEDRNSTFKKNMAESRKYWIGTDAPIHKRNVTSFKVQGKEIKDPTKANNKLFLRDFKKIVKQAANYSFAKPITIKGFAETAMKEIAEMLKLNKWQKKLLGFSTDSQRFAVGYFYPFIENGKFRFRRFDPSDIITFYSDGEGDELDGFIRYYKVWDYTTMKVKEKQTGKQKVLITKVELYTKGMQHNYGIVEGKIAPYNKKNFPQAGKLHVEPLITQTLKDGVTGEEKEKTLLAWQQVPLLSMWFDFESGMTALHELKEYIDAGSINLSDWANDVEDIQEAIWVLKGYDSKSLLTFIEDMKKKKAISLGDNDNADATPHTNEIPTEARDKLIKIIRESIYKYGRAVDTGQIPMTGDLRNIQIEAMFADQDEKATEFETSMTSTLNGLFLFFQDFRKIIKSDELKTEGLVSFIYTRTKIQNETELLSSNAGQVGIVSEETRLSNHPWVTNTQQEMDRLASESEPMAVQTLESLTTEQKEALKQNTKQLTAPEMQSLITIIKEVNAGTMKRDAAVEALTLLGVDTETSKKIIPE